MNRILSMIRPLLVWSVVVVALSNVKAAPPPRMVKDITTGVTPVSSNPANFCKVGNTVYFAATTATRGTELWKTDGTPEGTVFVKDANVGTASGNPRGLTMVGNELWFVADDDIAGASSWKTNGTSEGTIRIKTPPNAVRIGAMHYFVSSTTAAGAELWKSDGTDASLVMVKDIRPGTNSSSIEYLTEMNGMLYFAANPDGNGSHLFRSNGTAAGTASVKPLTQGGPNPRSKFCVMNGVLYFLGNTSTTGVELWRSDGTPNGTYIVKDIVSGSGSSNPAGLMQMGGVLYFTASDGTNGNEIWKSDGTTLGTHMLKDVSPGVGSSNISTLTKADGLIYFLARNAANGEEIWVTDGSEAGTRIVRDLTPGSSSTTIKNMTTSGGLLYFTTDVDGSGGYTVGYELWKSDGTSAGTAMIKKICPPNSLSGVDPQGLVDVGGEIYFRVDDTVHGFELWRSDGTPEGTFMVKDVATSAEVVSGGWWISAVNNMVETKGLTALGPEVFFIMECYRDRKFTSELWKSDGTASGTRLVKNDIVGRVSSATVNIVKMGSHIYFISEAASGYELWRTDGTPSGTAMVKPFPNLLEKLYAYGDALYFVTSTSGAGYELWKSDGTSIGTKMVEDIVPGGTSSEPDGMMGMNGVLYFTAHTSEAGRELWRTDGSEEGTYLVKDICPGASSGMEANTRFAVSGQAIYFGADDGVNGGELWKSDGTEAGTVMVRNNEPLYGGAGAGYLTPCNGMLYFTANAWLSGWELWKSDGTEAGTSVVKEIGQGNQWSSPKGLTSLGNQLLFFADYNKPVIGYALWKSDGTEAGTVMVKDIYPGWEDGGVQKPVVLGNKMYFTINDGVHGHELWESDGTTVGTRIVADLTGDSGSSTPSTLTVVGSRLFFTAVTEETGRELYVYDPSLPDLPKVILKVVDDVGARGATLCGDVDPLGEVCEVYYEYGSTEALGSESVIAFLGTGAALDVNLPVSGLIPGTTYYYRLVARNESGAVRSGIASFTTLTLYQDWSQQNGVTDGLQGNQDGDGLSNLLEYAFGTHPKVAQTNGVSAEAGSVVSHGMPVLSEQAAGHEAIFARRKDRGDSGLTYELQFSHNVTTWYIDTTAPTVLAEDSEVEVVSVPFPGQLPNGEIPRFFRVKVTQP